MNTDTAPRHGGSLPHRSLWPQDGEEEHSIYQVGNIRTLLTFILLSMFFCSYFLKCTLICFTIRDEINILFHRSHKILLGHRENVDFSQIPGSRPQDELVQDKAGNTC